MPHLIEQLQTLLTPLSTGGASYQINEAPQTPSEYITFVFVGGPPNVSLDGRNDLQNYRLQVDIFASRVQRLTEISAAVVAACETASAARAPVMVPIGNATDLYEEPVRLHRRILEFSVWSVDG